MNTWLGDKILITVNPVPAAFLAMSALAVPVYAQDSENSSTGLSGSRFGGPRSTEGFLDDIQRRESDSDSGYVFSGFDEVMQPWFDFKDGLLTRKNVRIGGHYQVNYQVADRVLEQPDYGFGGLFRTTGSWTPGGRQNKDSVRLSWTVDYRHKIGNGVAPSALGAQFGYLGTTNAILGDTQWDLYDLYLAVPSRNNTSGFALGRIDPNIYFYTYAFSNPWTGFTNNEVVNSVGLLQPQSAWGITGGFYLNDNVYAVAGTYDANGTATDDLDWFSGGSEFWSAIEVGWISSLEKRLDQKVSVSLWHVDARKEQNTEESYGTNITASWTFGPFNPFARVAYSSGNAPTYNQSVLLGFRLKTRGERDIFGVAFARGDSSTGLGWQSAIEVFYNYHLARNLAFTFDIQRIGNPLLNPVDDEVWLFGTRLRMTF